MDLSPVAETSPSYDEARHHAPNRIDRLPANAPDHGQISRGGDTKFQNAISAWRNIDLTQLISELDITATDLIAHQKDALLSRKDLAQKTKDFRKLDDAAKLVEIKGLLKAYQAFIDLLTNHGKESSSAFLRLYSPLSEASDPYPLLEASVDALLISEDTLPKVTLENEHLQTRLADLTHQLDRSEAQLVEERSSRQLLENGQDAKIKNVEVSWKAVMEEKKDNWESRERTLEGKIESQERLLSEMKANYEVTQRLGHESDTIGDVRQASASAAELEIISSDLDRANQRLAEVEARNEQFRTQLAEKSSSIERPESTQEDPSLSRLRSENSSLLRKLDNMRLEKDAEARKIEGRIRSLEKETQAAESDRDALRAKVNSWRDYNEMKQELEVFKSIEFSTMDDDDIDHADDGTNVLVNGVARPNHEDSLEKLLLARNKKLGNDMAVLRVSHKGLQQQLESLQETMSNTNAELERAQHLNATLETDLVKVQQEATNAFPSSAMSTAGTYTSRYPSSSFNANSFPSRKGRTSPTSSIISGFDPSSNSRNTLDSIRAGEPVGGGSGILPMIQAQRDRFKEKNSQLEEELAKQHNAVSSLRQEVASLQKDNLNLYEKSRYVSTYSRGQTSSASAYAQPPQTSTIALSDSTSSGLSLDRYRSTYEANLSPFAAFRGREHTRAYARMSVPERIVFSFTRMILANRMSRNLFAFYCLALHLLIFVMLYWMHSVDVSKNAGLLSDTAGAAAGLASQKGTADLPHSDWRQEGFIADPDG